MTWYWRCQRCKEKAEEPATIDHMESCEQNLAIEYVELEGDVE